MERELKRLMVATSVWDGCGGRSRKSGDVDGEVSTISGARGGMGVYAHAVGVRGVIRGVGA
jgi:hypothetical protein